MGYSQLLTYAPLAAYTQNRATVDEMPSIIRRAEEYIIARLDHDLFRVELPDTVVGDGGVIAGTPLPVDVLEVRSVMMQIGTDRWMALIRRGYETMCALHSDVPRGQPRYYAERGDRTLVAFPAPASSPLIKITVNQKPPPLSRSNQDNIITERFQELMEVAVVKEAAEFNLDQSAVALYAEKLRDILIAANNQISRWTRDESAQRPVETRNVTGK